MTLILRPGRADDANLCGQICYEAFHAISTQHNFPPDIPSPEIAKQFIEMILLVPHVYSVVAELDGRVVGSNFMSEDMPVAGIGPITVDPKVQNQAIGRKLMENVIQRAQQKRFASVRLVQAAFHNRSLSLYTKLGFDVKEPLATMQGPALKLEIPGYSVRPVKSTDVEACNELCTRIHGHARNLELLGAVQLETASLVEHNGRITGYTTSIGFDGHSVAETNEDLKALIGAADSFFGPGFHLPTRNGELYRWCLKNGLKVVQPMTLMSMGMYNEPAGAFLPSILF